jgi:hypothetical protein
LRLLSIWELDRSGCLVGMVIGMTTSKIAVSLPSELVEHAQRAVSKGRATSVSAYVARAFQGQAKLEDLASLDNNLGPR